MIFLGLDPGLATTGVGVISAVGSKHAHVYHGAIRTAPTQTFSDRLKTIADELGRIIDRYAPVQAAVEKLFFHTNKTTAMDVAQARGVMLLTLNYREIPQADYTPIQVKSSVCGYGKATKKQVQYMVQKLLNLPAPPKPDDAADGLALAICHAHLYRLNSKR